MYAAIGEAESRLRKPVTLNHAIQRLMVLDAIVEDPDLVWLGTAEEKSIHLTTLLRIDPADLPHVSIGEGDARTVRYFPDRLPIGIHPAGCGVVVYVVTDPWLDDFRLFLLRHAALLRALPAWTLRVVVPPHFPDIGQRAKQVVWNQLMTPLKTDILDELRWYFRAGASPPRAIPLSRPGRTVLPVDTRDVEPACCAERPATPHEAVVSRYCGIAERTAGIPLRKAPPHRPERANDSH